MKRIIIFSIFLAASILAKSQTATLTCNTNVSNSVNYSNYTLSARDQVTLGAGFSCSNGGSGYIFTVKTDHTIVPTTPSYLSASNIITGSSRTLDKSDYAPGSIGGTVNISPTGAANFSFPIQVSPGSHGMQPNLDIVYSSQSGNDILGYGFHLSGLSAISRVNKNIYYDGTTTPFTGNAITMTTADDGLMLDGQRLILNPNYSNAYSPENDPYTVVQYTSAQDYFTVTTKDGIVISYGNSSIYSNNSKFYAKGSSVAYSWAIDRITDPDGNYVQYNYLGDNTTGEYRINEIKYTGNGSNSPYNSINFYYEKRTDIDTMYEAGHATSQSMLLTAIKVIAEGVLAYDYEFSYFFDGLYSKLNQIGLTSNGTSYNPTIINWGATPNYAVNNSNLPNAVFGNPSTDRLYFGDFNGDGRVDVAKLNGYGLISVSFATGGGQYTTYTVPVPIDSTIGTVNNYVYKKFYIQDVQVVDINNDGKDELMVHIIELDSAQSPIQQTPQLKNAIASPTSYFLYKYDEVYSYSFNGTAFTSNLYGSYLTGSSSNLPITNADYYLWFYCDYNNSGYVNQLMLKNGTLYVNGGPIEQNVVDVRVIDFNGDGQADLLVISNSSFSVWTYNGTSFSSIFSSQISVQPSELFTGDFNGDGKTDILINGGGIYYSTGTGLIWTNEPFSYTAQSKIFIKDMNNDGKDDIINASNGIVSLYISTGTSFVETLTDNLSKSSGNIDYNIYAADLNADGQKEIIYGNNNNTGSDYYNISFQSRLDAGLYANSFTDGNNVNAVVTYAPVFTNSSGVRNYPVIPIVAPLYLATNLVRKDLNTGSVFANISGTYQNAYMHLQGKGFLGFSTVITTDAVSLDTITSNYNNTIPNATGIYYTWLYNQTAHKNGVAVSTVGNSMSAEGGNVANKLFYPLTTTSETTNNLTKVLTTNTILIFNTITGRVEKSNMTTNGWSIETDATYQTITGNESVLTGVNTIRTNGLGQFTNTLGFTHTNSSFPFRLTSQTIQGIVTTKYTGFDNYGNVTGTQAIVSDAYGTPNRSTNCNYDNYGVFIISSTDVTGLTSKASYRSTDGAILSQTDANGLVTSYSYSTGGNAMITTATLPDGNTVTTTVGWDGTGTGLYYTQKQITNGNTVTDYFNAAGWKMKETLYGNKNTLLTTTYSYNNDGTVNTITPPGLTSAPESFTYYPEGRLKTDIGLNKKLSYSYSGTSVTITDNITGQTKTQTSDGLGNVTQVTGTTGEVDYSYYPSGKVYQITTGGLTTTMSYDLLGNQLTLSDPNAGKNTYNYNGFGQLITQTDNKSQKTTCAYDSAGRLKTKTFPDGLMLQYNYSSTPGTLGLLQSVTRDVATAGDKQITESYAYDALCRTKTVTTSGPVIDKESTNSFQTIYTYNGNGQLASVAYPSGLTVNYVYDAVGNVTGINNAAGGAIWTGNTVDPLNRWTQFTLGNGVVTNYVYDQSTTYMLKNIQTTSSKGTSIQNLGFTFNSAGQLTQRTDGSLTENFKYDGLNRLDTAQVVGNATKFTVSYDPTVNGNINSATLAGTYSYDPNHPHAVNGLAGVSNTGKSTTTDSSSIAYNGENKILNIANGTYQDNFTYGVEGNRFRVDFNTSGTWTMSKFYIGNSEFGYNTSNSVIYKRTLITAPTGVCAVYQDSGGVKTFYYIHTDYLGSWLAITDSTGSLKNHYSYDAWGRPRDPTTWQLKTISITNALANLSAMQPRFDHGYTGHELMAGFGLINMNGRLYDPYLQRFLSPDNNIQDPSNSHNFNRYSYCLNNPLSYSDPSGNDYLMVPIGGGGGGCNFPDYSGPGNGVGGPDGSFGGFGPGSQGYFYSWGTNTYIDVATGNEVDFNTVYNNYILPNSITYYGNEATNYLNSKYGFFNSSATGNPGAASSSITAVTCPSLTGGSCDYPSTNSLTISVFIDGQWRVVYSNSRTTYNMSYAGSIDVVGFAYDPPSIVEPSANSGESLSSGNDQSENNGPWISGPYQTSLENLTNMLENIDNIFVGHTYGSEPSSRGEEIFLNGMQTTMTHLAKINPLVAVDNGFTIIFTGQNIEGQSINNRYSQGTWSIVSGVSCWGDITLTEITLHETVPLIIDKTNLP
jgi:RHS repeat-associated protein